MEHAATAVRGYAWFGDLRRECRSPMQANLRRLANQAPGGNRLSRDVIPTSEPMALLDVDMLAEGHGLTEGWARVIAEAASVCLDSQGHRPPVALEVVEGAGRETVSLLFLGVTDDLRRNHRDHKKATENGACGVAILVCRHRLGYGGLEQTYQSEGGFDYWIGDMEEGRPLNRKMRLEVSGIRSGDTADIQRRLGRKRKTTAKSDGAYPVVVIVVEFGGPQAHLEARG